MTRSFNEAFGLVIDTDISLLGLPSFEKHTAGSQRGFENTVSVRRAAYELRFEPAPTSEKVHNVAPGSSFGDRPGNGIFRASDGYLLHLEEENEAVFVWLSADGTSIRYGGVGADEGDFPPLIAGTFLSAAAALRGRTPLHGSCLQYNGRFIAILAASGTGKSSLSAALARQPNVTVWTDDAVAIDRGDDAPWCLRFGSRAVRIDAPLAARLDIPRSQLGPMHRMSSKYLWLSENPWQTSVQTTPTPPIVVLLERRECEGPTLRQASDQEAFAELIRHRHPPWLEMDSAGKRRFAENALRLVTESHVLQLVVPDDRDKLPDVASWLLARLASRSALTSRASAAGSENDGS